jgi:hypothetical protein
MPRNTNISELLFPVREENVYLSNSNSPIPRFKAIVGNLGNGLNTTFSIVSEDYQLISNEQAIEYAKQIHLKLFPKANAQSFVIFNIMYPGTRSYCHIDIIDKNYELNIWKQEVYVPFIRIQNSYNRSRPLLFNIGFCRKLCDNGVIFENSTIELKFSHIRKEIRPGMFDHIDVSHLKKMESDFINKISKSQNVPIPRMYFIPVAAKVLNRRFNLDEKDPKRLNATMKRLSSFVYHINYLSEKYVVDNHQGETAYALFNTITDYVSNSDDFQKSAINGMQKMCGTFISGIGEKVKQEVFSWDEEIKDYMFMLN